MVKAVSPKPKPKSAFGEPPPVIGDLVKVRITGRRWVQGKLIRRTKRFIVIHPEGGVDIQIERPQ